MAKQLTSMPKHTNQLILFHTKQLDVDGTGQLNLLNQKSDLRLDVSDFWSHVASLHRFRVTSINGGQLQRLEDLREPCIDIIKLRFSKIGSAEKCMKTVNEFFNVQLRNGAEYLSDVTAESVEDFIWMGVKRHGFRDPSRATASNRQWAVRVLLDVLTDMGLWDGKDISGRSVDRTGSISTRPATAEELVKIKAVSRNGLVSTGEEILVALSLCGANAQEIALAQLSDIDFENSTIRLQGPDARTNPIDEWSRSVLASVRNQVGGPIASAAEHQRSIPQAAHSITVRLNRIISHAGYSNRRDLRGVSIRLGVAHEILNRSGLEAAARFLGNQSLDATAKSLGYDWRCRS